MTPTPDEGQRAGRWTMVIAGLAVAALALVVLRRPLPVADEMAWVPAALLGVAVLSFIVALLGAVGLIYSATSPRGRVRADFGHRGFASWRRLYRAGVTSGGLLRHAGVPRRRLVLMSPARRARAAALLATYVGRVVVGPRLALRLWVPHRDVVIGVAPPQTGKTAWLARKINEHVGAVVSTSTKTDVWRYTHQHRAHLSASRGVDVFNPTGLGQVPSTFAWDPLSGCRDPSTATERADHLVDGAHVEEGLANGGYFAAQAKRVLRVLLLAAALDGLGFEAVGRWVNHPDESSPVHVLEDPRHHPVPSGWVDQLVQLQQTDKRQRDAIYNTLALATGFIADPVVAAACRPRPGRPSFDLEDFLRDRGTLYLIGSAEGHDPIAPLITALTGCIFEQAKRLGGGPGGPLDPALMMALDEVALITPVPLDQWNADAGGRGIHLIEMVQARSQVFARWGERRGQNIFNTANCKLHYGGINEDDELEAISRLCGERAAQTVSINTGASVLGEFGAGRTYSPRDVRVIPLHQVRLVPPWHHLVVYRNLPPTMTRFVPVWDTDPRRARRG